MRFSGLGLSLSETERKARLIERHFRLLPDSLATHQEWRRLIVAHSVNGVEVHDTRLNAAMTVYQISDLSTINRDDFKRYSWITVLPPEDVT